MRKIIVSLLIISIIIISFTGCPNKMQKLSNNNINISQKGSPTSTSSSNISSNKLSVSSSELLQKPYIIKNPIIRYVDLTHDGVNEKIVVNQFGHTSDGIHINILVFKINKENETLLWEDGADTSHVGWNGIYLYQKDGLYYLMRWYPYACTGTASFMYEVFSLTSSGKKITFDNEHVEFSCPPKEGDVNNINDVIKFTNNANYYLQKSIVLIDTYNGNLVYSTIDNPIVNKYYDRAWLNGIIISN